MRNLLALVGLGLVLFLGLGWYLNWYSFSAKPSTDGHTHIEFDINGKKVGADVQKGVEAGSKKINDWLSKDGKAAPKDGGGQPAPNDDGRQQPPPPPPPPPESKGGPWRPSGS